MTNKEAQFILDAYRPGGRDANDPMFAEALKQAQQDPSLEAWFAREQSHAGKVAGKLREMAPPAGLREAILAGAKVSKMPPPARWSRPSWLAIAAAVAILGTVAGIWRWSTNAPLNRLENFVTNDALHGAHGSHGAAVNALTTMLSQASTRMGGTLPVDFSTLRLSGCRTMSFAGRDILEVCFERGGSEFHLYMARREDFPGLRNSSEARYGEREGLGLVSWGDATHQYVLASKAGVAALQRLM